MSCPVDIPGRPAFFAKAGRGVADVGERGGGGGDPERSGGRGKWVS